MPLEVGELTGLRRGAADAGFSRVSTQQKKVLLFRSTPVKCPVLYYQMFSTHENECLKYSKVKRLTNSTTCVADFYC